MVRADIWLYVIILIENRKNSYAIKNLKQYIFTHELRIEFKLNKNEHAKLFMIITK